MKRIVTSVLAVAAFAISGFAQFDQNHHCKGEELTKKHYQELGVWDEFQQSYQETTVASNGYKNFSKAAGQIPIIFHVVYNNSSDSVTYADVLSVYNDLVSDFSAAGSARGGFGFNPFNPDIEFCLATREPNGTPLLYPGMTIAQTTKTWFDSDNGEENMMKTAANGSQIWNRDQYLNVWICDISNGAGSGTAGYAYRPSGSAGNPPIFLPGAAIDGIVLDYNLGVNNQNVLTHEVGHYMGLDHPWGGSGGCGNDDGFGDTPFTDGPSFDHAESCSGNQVQCGVQTQYENFMDYANCTSMFSEDQSNHMNYVLDNARASLLTSNGCAPSNAPPIAAFTADLGGNPIIIPVGGSINFIDQSLNVDPASNPNWAWTFGGGSAAQNVQNPIAQFNTIGVYTVTMTVTNDYGNDVATKVGHVEVVAPAVGIECDTLRNYDLSENMIFYGVTNPPPSNAFLGYLPGHLNVGTNVTHYAEPFSAPATTEVRRLLLNIQGVVNTSTTGSFTVRVYGDDAGNNPDEADILDTEVINFADVGVGWNEIDLLTPATVTGAFWVGLEINYPTAGDTIIFGTATENPTRPAGFNNTLTIKSPGSGWNGNDWGTADEIFGPTQNFSLGLDVLTSLGPDPSALISIPENQVCEGAVIIANGSGSTNTTDYFWFNTDDPITTIYADGVGANFGVNFPFAGDELYILFADGSCRTSVAQESIHVDSPVAASASITNTTCGQNNGVITVTGETGGTGTYEYSLDGTNWVTTDVFSNMAPGNYTVYVRTPGSECQTDFQVTINADPVFTPTVSANQEICIGESIDITAGGGTGYNWLDGNTSIGATPTVNVTPASTTQYTCNVTDASSCLVTVYTTVVVKDYEDPSFTANDFCVGAANAATITGKIGGTFAFNPAPGDGATINPTTGEISNEVGGTTYTIEYTTPGVGSFCENTSTVSVTVTNQEDASFTTTDFCEGAPNSANITGTTGGTFTFNPAPGDGATIDGTSGEITNGIAGTSYSIEYTTAGTCNDVQTESVTVNPGDDASFTTTDFCVGAVNSANITGTTGGTFAFNPAPGDGATINPSTGEISNEVAGANYTIEYTTPAGVCQTSTTQNVAVNNLDDATFTTTDFCEGSSNNPTITGTTGGLFTFNPAPGDGATIDGTSGEISNGIAGTSYTIEYSTPAGACQNNSTQAVTVLTNEDASFTLTDFCLGSSNSATGIATTGGTFTFSVAPGDGATINNATGEISNGVLNSTYSIQYQTPGVGCQNTSVETVTVLNSDDASFTVSDFCANATNSATITGTGGGTFSFTTPPGDGATIDGTSGEISNGVGGTTYDVTYATPAGVCQATSNQTVDVLLLDDASFTTSNFCEGTSNNATITGVSSGTFAFNPAPSDAAIINPSTGEIVGGTGGTTYSIEYTTPSGGCQNSSIETVDVNPSDDASFVLTDFCSGTANSATSIATTGGTFTFTSAPGDGSTVDPSTGEISNGVAGTTYSLNYTTPASGCQNTSTETVTVTSNDDASFTFDDFCEGTSNSATSILTTGGTFSFTTPPGDGATIDNSTGEITNGIGGSTYGVTYTTPPSGCQSSSNLNVMVNTLDDASFTLTDFCVGQANSATGIATSGGTFDFTTPPGDGATIDNTTGEISGGISGSTYDVTYTTPSSGCQNSMNQIVNVNSTPMVNGVVNNISCNGDMDGEIDLTITGAVPTSITWTNSAQTTEDLSGLGANTYQVTVDAGGCATVQDFIVTEPDPIVIDSINVTDIICNGDVGTATLFASGGTGTITADWGAANPNSLTGGTYPVVVTDANNCSANQSITISEPPLLEVTGSMTEETAGNDGAIDLTVTGGVPPYEFSWSNNETTEDISNLSPGSYTVTVTDDKGCSHIIQFNVTTTIGIDESYLEQVAVFPNPFQDEFTIELKGSFEFDIRDARGRIVRTGKAADNHTIDLSSHEMGVYFLRLKKMDSFKVVKLIKRF